MKSKAELMSPVGSYESLAAAIKAGADSVYFGVDKLNMRVRAAKNFRLVDLKKISYICKENKINTYLTINTIIYDNELGDIKKICGAAKKANIDAIIASDVSVMSYAKSIGLAVHASTQLNVSNIEAVKFYSKFVDTIVLARELDLKQIHKICKEVKKQKIQGPSGNIVKIEIFIHGALCVSIAGKCYMSLSVYNHSANRGDCLQNCRRSYIVTDSETGEQLVVDNSYVMSPKDLCTIRIIDKILATGVSILKIEGRGRSPDYVYTVTKVYREVIDACHVGKYDVHQIEKWEKQLAEVFNRGFWQGGYYLGKKLGEWSTTYGSMATTEKVFIGKVLNYFGKKGVVETRIQTGKIKLGEKILITGPTTGAITDKISSIFNKESLVKGASKGDHTTFLFKTKVRKNDKIYVIRKRKN